MVSSTDRLTVSTVAAGASGGTRKVTITWMTPWARALAKSSSLTPGPGDWATAQPTMLSTSRSAPATRHNPTTCSRPRTGGFRDVVRALRPGEGPGDEANPAMAPDESCEPCCESQENARCRKSEEIHGRGKFCNRGARADVPQEPALTN